MDYELGLVTFLNPDSLFTGPTEVRAQFEENQLFDVAPRSILGLAATYNLNRDSRIVAVGIVQRDRTTFTRPQLGFEPQAGFMGGVTAELLFRPAGLTRLLDALPLIETATPSRLTINGEVAPNAAPYKFMLWAGDGTSPNGEDTFRIKIWWEEDGAEHVVYDNGTDQEIGGGSIVVHTKK